jgi:hypothetical protein
MSLADLIRKREPGQGATATPATAATEDEIQARTVAGVATVAVASSLEVGVTGNEESALRAWLAHIGETDAEIIAHVLDRCRRDAEARDYFLLQAGKDPRGTYIEDDRRRCDQCANLTERGLCLAAWRGEIVANRSYEPVRDWLRRCEGYAPGPDDPDRRAGREKWPGLIQKGNDDANT